MKKLSILIVMGLLVFSACGAKEVPNNGETSTNNQQVITQENKEEKSLYVRANEGETIELEANTTYTFGDDKELPSGTYALSLGYNGFTSIFSTVTDVSKDCSATAPGYGIDNSDELVYESSKSIYFGENFTYKLVEKIADEGTNKNNYINIKLVSIDDTENVDICDILI